MSAISCDQEFESDICNFISDWLYDHIDETFYVSDLRSYIINDCNMDGYWIFGTANAMNYICDHRWISADLINYYQDECGTTLNAFANPESFTVWMLDYGVNELLNENEYIRDHWDEEIELTEEIAQSILDNL